MPDRAKWRELWTAAQTARKAGHVSGTMSLYEATLAARPTEATPFEEAAVFACELNRNLAPVERLYEPHSAAFGTPAESAAGLTRSIQSRWEQVIRNALEAIGLGSANVECRQALILALEAMGRHAEASRWRHSIERLQTNARATEVSQDPDAPPAVPRVSEGEAAADTAEGRGRYMQVVSPFLVKHMPLRYEVYRDYKIVTQGGRHYAVPRSVMDFIVIDDSVLKLQRLPGHAPRTPGWLGRLARVLGRPVLGPLLRLRMPLKTWARHSSTGRVLLRALRHLRWAHKLVWSAMAADDKDALLKKIDLKMRRAAIIDRMRCVARSLRRPGE